MSSFPFSLPPFSIQWELSLSRSWVSNWGIYLMIFQNRPKDLLAWCVRFRSKCFNFPWFPFLEGPILLQPLFQKNLWTAIRPDATYVVVIFSLTHKGNFSIVFPWKNKSLSSRFFILCHKNPLCWCSFMNCELNSMNGVAYEKETLCTTGACVDRSQNDPPSPAHTAGVPSLGFPWFFMCFSPFLTGWRNTSVCGAACSRTLVRLYKFLSLGKLGI